MLLGGYVFPTLEVTCKRMAAKSLLPVVWSQTIRGRRLTVPTPNEIHAFAMTRWINDRDPGQAAFNQPTNV